MSEKEILEKTEVEEAPERDRAGRKLLAERATVKGEDAEKSVVIATVPGVVVEADDRDGDGLARALSTLAAMVPDA